MPSPERPILFLDVDGPLNPYAAKPTQRPEGYETHRFFEGTHDWGKRGLRVWLNPEHGKQLLALPFDLVWGTTWQDMANEHVGPVLGLPELPVVHFGLSETKKIPALVRYAAGRPFAWVDDEIDDWDHEYATKVHTAPFLLRAPFLLHQVDPSRGLVEADFCVLREWAANLGTEVPQ